MKIWFKSRINHIFICFFVNRTNYIKLEFLDNGIGIPDIRKDTIFKEEYVKDISSKGLGIGLTLVKKIVESYEGEIWVI